MGSAAAETPCHIARGVARFVRDAYHLREAVKYIIENPVRAGLVKRVGGLSVHGILEAHDQKLMEIAYSN